MAEAQDRSEVLPPLTPVEDLDLKKLLDVLSPKERDEMKDGLDEMARLRREAEATSSELRLS